MIESGSYSFLHIGAYLIGLTNPMAESESYSFLHMGAYLIGLINSMAESGSYPLSPGLTLDCQFIFYSFGLTFNCQYFSFLSAYLDLPSSASSFHFSFFHLGLPSISIFFSIFSIFIWVYTWLPVQTRLNSFNRFNLL